MMRVGLALQGVAVVRGMAHGPCMVHRMAHGHGMAHSMVHGTWTWHDAWHGEWYGAWHMDMVRDASHGAWLHSIVSCMSSWCTMQLTMPWNAPRHASYHDHVPCVTAMRHHGAWPWCTPWCLTKRVTIISCITLQGGAPPQARGTKRSRHRRT